MSPAPTTCKEYNYERTQSRKDGLHLKDAAMALTKRQKELIVISFDEIAPNIEAAIALFYRRLLELDPSLRPMFSRDPRLQEYKFADMLTSFVVNMEHTEWLRYATYQLGKRHHRYGATDADYDTMKQALLWGLAQICGASFSDEVKAAWAEFYTYIAGLMKEAARS
jgi:hemoglobin-like flavoprotein